MKNIAVFYNLSVPMAQAVAGEVGTWLAGQGIDVWMGETADRDKLEQIINGLDLLVVLGGDGTTLLSARIAAHYEVPIFGINLGRVGFLSEAALSDWQSKLEKVIRGECWIEKRLMLSAAITRDGQSIANLSALNEIVVSRGSMVRVVRFHLYVDGDHVITYTADGLIAATPTGSTAYSMAAGGPVLPPRLQNFLVLPVAPHLSFERPIVLHQEAKVKIQVEMEHEAIAAADGQNAIALQSGDEVTIGKYTCESHFARVDGPSYFYHRLMQHLSFWSRIP
ncbi:MAG TPA: NAD(+)/NADH kinase [candidate division Zixibacteria bacterium]|nr:NAD(+)/NADH kinase [candidate division Zixibacteria bacterium]